MTEKNNYMSAASWRDQTSGALGGITATLISIQSDIKAIYKIFGEHETRIKRIEEYFVSMKAVNKFAERMKGAILTIIGIIAGVVGTLLAK